MKYVKADFIYLVCPAIISAHVTDKRGCSPFLVTYRAIDEKVNLND